LKRRAFADKRNIEKGFKLLKFLENIRTGKNCQQNLAKKSRKGRNLFVKIKEINIWKIEKVCCKKFTKSLRKSKAR